MTSTQEATQKLRREAKRLDPSDELTPEDFEAMTEDRLALIQAGRVQFWRVNETVGMFAESALPGVWQHDVYFADPAADGLDKEISAVVRAFWESEHPEYIVTYSSVTWPNISLLQSAGFHQTGVLPLSYGPVLSWGWRKCH